MGVAALGLAAAGKAYSTSSRNKENNKAIADYKKEHPNTKLSNDEILENYYGDK
jgi:ABC-type glycerol-3-phosphate transport system substrate-binding protein